MYSTLQSIFSRKVGTVDHKHEHYLAAVAVVELILGVLADLHVLYVIQGIDYLAGGFKGKIYNKLYP